MIKDMTPEQEKMIEDLFYSTGKTFHRLAREAGVKRPPDKFIDCNYNIEQQIINYHIGAVRC
jgi:hypothetical protein